MGLTVSCYATVYCYQQTTEIVARKCAISVTASQKKTWRDWLGHIKYPTITNKPCIEGVISNNVERTFLFMFYNALLTHHWEPWQDDRSKPELDSQINSMNHTQYGGKKIELMQNDTVTISKALPKNTKNSKGWVGGEVRLWRTAVRTAHLARHFFISLRP